MFRIFIVAAMILACAPAWSDPEANNEKIRLKRCVVQVLDSLHANDRPNAASVLERCQAEYDAMLLALPHATSVQVDNFIRNDITAELRRRGR